MIKKIVIGLIGLVIVCALAGHFLWSNLDALVREAVEKYGSAATETAVRLDGFKLSLTTGEGSLRGLSVGSPAGFKAQHALTLGTVSVKVDPKSIVGKGPIVIDDITIVSPQVTYEVLVSGNNNLQTIARNAQNYANKFSQGTEEKSTSSQSPARKIIIGSLTVLNGQISIKQPLLGGRQLQAPLPTLHLTNIGKDENGVSPADLVRILLNSITDSASKVAMADLAKQLGNLNQLGNLKGVPSNLMGGAGSQLNSILGK